MMAEDGFRKGTVACADFDDVDARELSGNRNDTSCQVEVEEKMLAEGFLGGDIEPPDDFAQRR